MIKREGKIEKILKDLSASILGGGWGGAVGGTLSHYLYAYSHYGEYNEFKSAYHKKLADNNILPIDIYSQIKYYIELMPPI